MKITQQEFEEANEQHLGYCTECDAITGEDCEPDAEDYECPLCGGECVIGLETALLLGKIVII